MRYSPFIRRLPVLIVAAAALAVAGLLLARSHAEPGTYDVGGTVQMVLPDGRLIVAHEDIPGFMPAMTMAFGRDDAAGAPDVAPGDRIRFRLKEDDVTRIDRVRIVARNPAPTAPPRAVRPRPARLKEGDAVAPFMLLDQDGGTLTAADLRDRHTIVTFIFTRCPVPEFCPAMMLRFGELQDALAATPAGGTPVRLLSITLDPEFDRPEILRAYGEAVGADFARWQFGTGDKAEVDALASAFAVYREHNGVTLDHTLTTALIGPDGRVISIWRGHGWKSAEVIEALAAAR